MPIEEKKTGALIKLTLVEATGEWYFHKYKLGNEYFEQECTQQEYENMPKGGPTLPKGALWLGSAKGTRFNTASGSLENGQYFLIDKVAIVKLPGKIAIPVAQERVVADELAKETENFINAHGSI